MDLIYTNAAKEDLGVLFDYEFDLAFGGDENTFECTILADKHCCEPGSFLYIEGTEYGGIVDSIKVDTEKNTITYLGRTWHGILEGAVIQPESGYDYHFVTGEGNAVLAGLIEYLGLSDIFVASIEESGIHVANYAFRYVDAYSGICKMLAEFDGKLKMKHDVDKVILYTEPLVDYSQDDEFDSSQVDFTVQKNHRPLNHLICLGQGNLKDRYVIHLFTDENGGVQPYKTVGNPVEDADYILDQSGKLLTGVDEVAEVLNYPNAQTVENFLKLTKQPDDWAKNYASYFKRDDTGNYVNVEGVPSEAVTLLEVQPDDWSKSYASYFVYQNGKLKSVEAVTTEGYTELTSKPVDWETNYKNYFTRTSDGVSETYHAVTGVSATRYVPQTMQPSDWKTNYKSYFKRGFGSQYVAVEAKKVWSEADQKYYENAPKWEAKRYYTAETYEVAPEWTSKQNRTKYYAQYKVTSIPAFVSGKYYSKHDVLLTPSFVSGVMFRKAIDHYAELVASGLERLMQSYNCDSVDIDLDLEGSYDIGDIVGAVENTTRITVWQPITKKIVTIKNGFVTVSMKMDVKNVSTYMNTGSSGGLSGGFGGSSGGGEPGADGQDGKDGVSCTHSWNGTVLTVTSASGTSSADLKGEKGDAGYTPQKGVDYFDGKDGKDGAVGSPGQDGYTPQKGVDYFDGEDGQPGKDGQNGVSCTHEWNGTTLIVTSASGTSYANLKGEKGDPGEDGYTPVKGVDYFDGSPGAVGSPGANGKDGVSATHSWNGTTLTVTSASGTSSADLKGEQGQPGSAGRDGNNGVSCTHSWNGTTLTVTSASGTSSANLKGEKGDPGQNGSPGANATINGVNTLTIKAGTNVSLSQSGSTLTINASGGTTATAMTVAQIRAICT